MKRLSFTVENTLYLLSLLLALGLRLVNLGAVPLSDNEARWALQALSVAHGEHVALGSQPAYIFLTGFLFFVFGSANFVARLVPALAGAGLAFTPVAFKHLMGRRAALIMALGLALDPGLIALSRQAGSPMPALGFGMLVLAFIFGGQLALAGICAGLFLLCGPAALAGIISVLISVAIIKLLEARGTLAIINYSEIFPDRAPGTPIAWRSMLIALAVTLLLVGTYFFRQPEGLGAWMASAPDYIKGWIAYAGIPALRLPLVLFIYQPLGLLFALAALWIVWRWSPLFATDLQIARRMSIWALVGLLLALGYAGRQASDLDWVLIPLWSVAAIGLAYMLEPPKTARLVAAGLALVFLLLMALFWLQLDKLGSNVPGTQEFVLNLAVLLAVVGLAFLTTLLVGLGWSPSAARAGLTWGLLAGMGLYVLSNGINISQQEIITREVNRQELWAQYPVTGDAKLVVQTLNDLSNWNTGQLEAINIRSAVDSPALKWALRDFPQVEYVSESQAIDGLRSTAPQNMPAILLTRQAPEMPTLTAAYRGQDFAWWWQPDWQGVAPEGFLNWLTFREAPWRSEQIILWARADMLPGGILQPAGSPEQTNPN